MIALSGELPPTTAMILTVHDELLLEAPRGEADAAAARVRDCMSGAADLRVPLTVDVGIGDDWMAREGLTTVPGGPADGRPCRRPGSFAPARLLGRRRPGVLGERPRCTRPAI